MEQGQSNWVGYHISVNSASARKTKEGRSSKCLGLEGGSLTKFCTRQLPWRLLSYFGLYCFVSASFFGDNFTLDDLASDYYSFWNCPGGLSYDCFVPPQHNLKQYHKYFQQIHLCVPAGASNLLHKTINDYQNVTDFSILVHEVSRIVRFSRVFWRFFKAP